MHVAVQALALRFEALEDALRDVERLLVAAVRLGLDAGAEQVGHARLDVLHYELKLLQAPVGALCRFVELALLGPARLGLCHAVVRARILLDLLARSANVAPQRVDQCIELRFEVVRILDETRLRCRGPSIWTDTGRSGDHRVSAWSLQQNGARVLGHDPPPLLPQGRNERAIGSEEHLIDLVSVEDLFPPRAQLHRLAPVREDLRQEREEPAIDEYGPLGGAPDQITAPVVLM